MWVSGFCLIHFCPLIPNPFILAACICWQKTKQNKKPKVPVSTFWAVSKSLLSCWHQYVSLFISAKVLSLEVNWKFSFLIISVNKMLDIPECCTDSLAYWFCQPVYHQGERSNLSSRVADTRKQSLVQHNISKRQWHQAVKPPHSVPMKAISCMLCLVLSACLSLPCIKIKNRVKQKLKWKRLE